MTNETERQPEETRGGEDTEGMEMRSLDDATLEPRSHVEQTGDVAQAEAIQAVFETLEIAGSGEQVADSLQIEEVLQTVSVQTSQEDTSMTGRQQIIPVEEQLTSSSEDEPGGSDVTPINIPLPIPGDLVAQVVEEDDSGQSIDARRASYQPDTTGADISGRMDLGIKLNDAGMEVLPLPSTEGLEMEVATPGSDQGTPQGETTGPVDQAEGQGDTSEGSEGDEWIPPEMYAHVDSSGNVTIVDGNGDPLDSPPIVTKFVGEDGKEKYMAYYEVGGTKYSFEIPDYISSLTGLSVGYDKDGNSTVVNGKGEAVDSPPMVTKFVDEKGMEKYMIYYPGAGKDSGVVVDAYSGSLQDCHALIGQDGKITIVDADGNPLTCQPVTSKYLDDKGVEHVTAYYPGTGEEGKVTLSSYSTSLENCYAHVGQDGKVTIVDSDGNPLKCQPVTSKYVDDKGVEHITAYYPGAGEAGKITLSDYSTSLQGCYAHYGQDGTVTIVDASGKPLPSQPLTYKYMDNKGMEQVSAYYPGAGEGGKVTLSAYTTSLQNCYVHYGQDGKITVVGADGKPLPSQPLTYKYVDNKGVEHVEAYYPGDKTKTTLSAYLPPSGKPKSGAPI